MAYKHTACPCSASAKPLDTRLFQCLFFYTAALLPVLSQRLFARLIRTFLIHAKMIFPARAIEAAAVAVPLSGAAA